MRSRKTSAWTPGERVEQEVALRVPPDAPPGAYRVQVLVRPVHSTRPLRVKAFQGEHRGRYTVTLGTLTVELGGPDAPPSRVGVADPAHRRDQGARATQEDRGPPPGPPT